MVRARGLRWIAVVVAFGLIAGCGGGKGKDAEDDRDEEAPSVDEIQRGGSLRYAVEAETGDGWCLQEAQLAISGILVARAIYDTLTVPNSEGDFVPYLASAVEPNEDYTEWTITVRDDVTFHDGTPLTNEVVKNNLDAYRGYVGPRDEENPHPTRSPLLFLFVMENIDDVQLSGDKDVVVTTKVPWVAFPAFLYSSGRLGITGQAQLDDTESCNTNLVGTGPFMLESPDDWIEGRTFTATKNPDYWQDAPDGEPYPYLEELVFEPIVDSEQRVNALEADDVQIGHFSAAQDIISVRDLTESGALANYDTNINAEVGFLQLNDSRPPFDDIRIRRAIALAIDPADYAETINKGVLPPANGPFAPGSPAYLEDTGYPTEGDPAEAERLIAEYVAEAGEIRPVVLMNTPDTLSQEQSVYLQQTLEAVGLPVELETVQQDALIDRSISGEYDMQAFRNYPGGDPDELYVWFKSLSPVNFSRIDDPEIDRLLDEGRSETDPDVRTQIYQDINRRFGEQVWDVWFDFTNWTIGAQPGVHGYDPETFPPLPDDGGSFDEGITVGHPLHGLWIEQ